MAAKYEIVRTISSNPKRDTAQVTVNYNGRVVTRHIKNGVGKHPDDALPGIHQKLQERISENQREQQFLLSSIAALQEKKPENWEANSALLELKRKERVDTLPGLIAALEMWKKEDPLMVSYF